MIPTGSRGVHTHLSEYLERGLSLCQTKTRHPVMRYGAARGSYLGVLLRQDRQTSTACSHSMTELTRLRD